MKHIIYTYKDKVYQLYKDWDFLRIEKVLERLGATYWEIGIEDNELCNVMREIRNEKET